uniref:SFRICE_003820 n=1 Tax=Spodoptera frugiperda TaxID=7108 RepID=A0A2H1W2J2_SPOFR
MRFLDFLLCRGCVYKHTSSHAHDLRNPKQQFVDDKTKSCSVRESNPLQFNRIGCRRPIANGQALARTAAATSPRSSATTSSRNRSARASAPSARAAAVHRRARTEDA